MALFCSLCKPQIHCPKFPTTFPIQRPLILKTSIIPTPHFEISKFSISAQTRTRYYSNLNSSVELEEETFPNVVIFVKGLAQSTGEGGLKKAFSRCGEVSRVKLVLDKKTKQSMGCAYVWFVREEHAVAAIEEMNGQVKTSSAFIWAAQIFLEGRFIHVALVKPGSCKTRRDPSPYKF